MHDVVLLVSFFVSGISALVYQVSWQRGLYVVIGVDMDSVTIIVSVFMLGIGLGGMLGGLLSDSSPKLRVYWYAGAELSIAIYGFFSLGLLSFIGDLLTVSGGGVGMSALACMAFLLLPAALMGMTLPLLTMALNERRGSVGVSVGLLYFLNTMGAALGAGLVPFVLLPNFTLGQTVGWAVAGNFAVAILVVSFYLVDSRPSAAVRSVSEG